MSNVRSLGVLQHQVVPQPETGINTTVRSGVVSVTTRHENQLGNKPKPKTKEETKSWPFPAVELAKTQRIGGVGDHIRELVVGIPTIRRSKRNYLLTTLRSLLENTKQESADILRGNLLVVVMVGDLDHVKAQATVDEVQESFSAYIELGILEIIRAPPESYFPDMSHLKDRFNDGPQRTYWRSKQCLDIALLMEYSRTRGRHYLQLEDDVVTSEGWLKYVLYYINTRESEFFMIHFSRLGFIGKLFPSVVLRDIVRLFSLYFDEAPVDMLLPAHAKRQKMPVLTTAYTIFQHIGFDSSLDGKVQPLQDRSYTSAEKALRFEVDWKKLKDSGLSMTERLQKVQDVQKARRNIE
eukprot:CFRG8109T1